MDNWIKQLFIGITTLFFLTALNAQSKIILKEFKSVSRPLDLSPSVGDITFFYLEGQDSLQHFGRLGKNVRPYLESYQPSAILYKKFKRNAITREVLRLVSLTGFTLAFIERDGGFFDLVPDAEISIFFGAITSGLIAIPVKWKSEKQFYKSIEQYNLQF